MKPPFKMIVETDIEKYRYESWDWKEPETLAWIRSFKSGVFLDVGANIGIYSLYAASLFPKMKIFAFEPHSGNAIRLAENIKLNSFKNIHLFVAGIGSKACYKKFKSPDATIGSTGGQIGEIGGNVLVYSIDGLPMKPKFIKIDVDGNEYNIVKGMEKTLKSPKLKSVLIEIDNKKAEICDIFTQNGFKTDNKFNKLSNHSRIRREKEGIKVENIIFTR